MADVVAAELDQWMSAAQRPTFQFVSVVNPARSVGTPLESFQNGILLIQYNSVAFKIW